MFTLIIRGGRILVSTPLPFYQDLLRRFGFTDVEGTTHFDYGPDNPSPTYILDLRGPRLAAYLAHLASGGAIQGAGALDSALADALADRISAWAASAATPPPPAPAGAVTGREALLGTLTPREREVALAVLDGLSNAEIAGRLCVSEVTVKAHLGHIFAKTGVTSRTRLIKQLLSASSS
ncbi:MAG: helix-turn-helix transcriptional regulator [Symbiobacteriia bacterium]